MELPMDYGRSWQLAAVVLGAMLATGTPAVGADRPAAEDREAQLEQRIGEARERLALTDEQVEAATPILKAGLEKQAAVLAKHGIDLAARGEGEAKRLGLRALRKLRKDMDAVRTETVEKLSEVLTDDQVDEYREIQDENRSEMRRRIRAAR